ncbi:hypothetical protein MJM45_29875, partial [Salmonella enterica subsp. enterica serovar Kentucky]|nr:hypothetical protein [Salmonella enterica subsp. enterica serovar Kentucky]
GPKDLEIKTLLMDEQDHGFTLTGDTLTQAAITAANKSHMPYSVFGGECETPVRKARHGDSSGVRGAAWLWPLA